ncbi:TetR/AcrR family transcriptional regulator [Veronia nyctiphanis]|nr:TetR/AcrR family transcriptional regulator [Veronia nyctiphanis]
MQNKRQAAKAASKEALIKSAMTLIPMRGLDVSLDELCAHAGYSRGAFYVHFKTREDLQLELMRREGNAWLDALFGSGPLRNEEDLNRLIMRFVTDLKSGTYPITKDSGFRPYQLLDMCCRSERLKEAYLELVQQSVVRLRDIVVMSQQQGYLSKRLDAEQVASLLLLLSVGAHTMYDLDYPIDFANGSKTLIQLLQNIER